MTIDDERPHLFVDHAPDPVWLSGRASRFISTQLLSEEAALFETKWFDYRYLHPMQATELFLDMYRNVYRQAWGMRFDISTRELKHGVAKGFLFDLKPTQITTLWQARQKADQMGLPYFLFCFYTIYHLLLKGMYKRMPQPNQLIKSGALKAAKKKWADFLSGGRVFVSRVPQYRVENFRGDAPQNAHHEWIKQQVKNQPNPHTCIPDILASRLMSLEQAQKYFPKTWLELAIGETSTLPKPRKPSIEDDAFLPGCASIFQSLDPKSIYCIDCPDRYRKTCEKMSQEVKKRLKATLKTTTPKDDHKRKLTRERVRKHRAKKKSAME